MRSSEKRRWREDNGAKYRGNGKWKGKTKCCGRRGVPEKANK